MIGLVMASGLAGCAYEDAEDPQPTAIAERSTFPLAPTKATKDRDLLDVEASNYAELDRLLGFAPGTVIFADSGPVNGPGAGFGKTATVMTAGSYTVKAACVGAPEAQMTLNQDPRTGVKPLELIVQCSEALIPGRRTAAAFGGRCHCCSHHHPHQGSAPGTKAPLIAGPGGQPGLSSGAADLLLE